MKEQRLVRVCGEQGCGEALGELNASGLCERHRKARKNARRLELEARRRREAKELREREARAALEKMQRQALVAFHADLAARAVRRPVIGTLRGQVGLEHHPRNFRPVRYMEPVR